MQKRKACGEAGPDDSTKKRCLDLLWMQGRLGIDSVWVQ